MGTGFLLLPLLELEVFIYHEFGIRVREGVARPFYEIWEWER